MVWIQLPSVSPPFVWIGIHHQTENVNLLLLIQSPNWSLACLSFEAVQRPSSGSWFLGKLLYAVCYAGAINVVGNCWFLAARWWVSLLTTIEAWPSNIPYQKFHFLSLCHLHHLYHLFEQMMILQMKLPWAQQLSCCTCQGGVESAEWVLGYWLLPVVISFLRSTLWLPCWAPLWCRKAYEMYHSSASCLVDHLPLFIWQCCEIQWMGFLHHIL